MEKIHGVSEKQTKQPPGGVPRAEARSAWAFGVLQGTPEAGMRSPIVTVRPRGRGKKRKGRGPGLCAWPAPECNRSE
jgi:hypothetical protein